MKNGFGLLLLIFSFNTNFCFSQDYPYDIEHYPFIKYKKNNLSGHDNLPGFREFYSKWKSLILHGNKKIEILHIGDSHIQADFFTGRIRNRLQEFFPGSVGARGIVFPYNLAATNNPNNYRITSKNEWMVVNGVKEKKHKTGIIPAKIYAEDSVISIKIKQYDTLFNSGYDKVEMWYASTDTLQLITPQANTIHVLPGQGRLSVSMNAMVKNVQIDIVGAGEDNPFELYAIGLLNTLPGITYHALGLNGAEAEDYVKCNGFKKFLGYTKPDLIIVSLGTNDIYGKHKKLKKFTLYYERLILQIREVFPDKALILTTPSDHFIHGYLPNKKVPGAAKIVKETGLKFDAAIWDFYQIMGGENSMMAWDFNGLSSRDRVHLSKKGYVLQGDLFFNALLRGFEKAEMPANGEN